MMSNERQVLIIEDNIGDARALSAALKKRKHSVELARTGLEAIKLAQSRVFDVCYLPLMLPDMSGLECFKQIKGLLPEKTQYLMITDYSDGETLIEVKIAGIRRVLFKPFEMDTFIKCTEGLSN